MAPEMNCSEIRARIALLGDESPEREARSNVEAHAATCPDCREWLDAVVASLRDCDQAPPLGLAGAVLARTTGPACARSVERLPAFVDGALDGVDRQLMVEHARHCVACDALGRALARLRIELPTLAEVAPQPSLVHEILARTSRSARAERAWTVGRSSAIWLRALLRPQLAFEGAYVGALALAALFILGGGSIHDVKDDLEAWSERPLQFSVSPVDRALAKIERLSTVETNLDARAEDLRDAARRVGRALGSLWSPQRRPDADPNETPTTKPIQEGEEP